VSEDTHIGIHTKFKLTAGRHMLLALAENKPRVNWDINWMCFAGWCQSGNGAHQNEEIWYFFYLQTKLAFIVLKTSLNDLIGVHNCNSMMHPSSDNWATRTYHHRFFWEQVFRVSERPTASEKMSRKKSFNPWTRGSIGDFLSSSIRIRSDSRYVHFRIQFKPWSDPSVALQWR